MMKQHDGEDVVNPTYIYI